MKELRKFVVSTRLFAAHVLIIYRAAGKYLPDLYGEYAEEEDEEEEDDAMELEGEADDSQAPEAIPLADLINGEAHDDDVEFQATAGAGRGAQVAKESNHPKGSQQAGPAALAGVPPLDGRLTYPCIDIPSHRLTIKAVKDENLKNLLMSWYYTGYYTGLYEGQQRQRST
jgi:Survival motor neuron protein (SMN)